MELQFTVERSYTAHVVTVTVDDNAFTSGKFGYIREALELLPDVEGLDTAFQLEYGANGIATVTPDVSCDVWLVFLALSIHARLTLDDGEVRDSTNWYGYDGEPGNDGANNDEDAEDSDEDDDMVGDKV